jgi:hypothetical protein
MRWLVSFRRAAASLVLFIGTAGVLGAGPGPLRISDNGRYFVDAKGEPFYFLADTQWELFRRYSLEDAQWILENRKAKGFTVVMVMLTGVGDGTGPNLAGDRPWLNDNPATPNPAYFRHVDKVLRLAQINDIHLLVGLYHQTYGSRLKLEDAKAWAAWVTRRYRDYPNVMWTLYPKATDSYRPIVSKLAEGIHEGDGGRHLVSAHPDPSPASSSFLHDEPWLSFNSIQVWNELGAIYPMVTADYQRKPPKPATMLEGVYERGEEYHYPITPLLIRREAYYTCLAGGFHGYGHNDSWRVKPTWRSALDDPGAQQMATLKRILTGLPEWWSLVPDQSILVAGGNTEGEALNLAARSSAGRWIIAYVADQPVISVNMAAIKGAASASATWIDPSSGREQSAGAFTVDRAQAFTRPAEWPDGLLAVNAGTQDRRD